MKLVEMKCKNCGANLKVEASSNEVTCQFCHTTFKIDDEVQHHQIDNAEQAGYEFEKGKIRAQEEAEQEKIRAQEKAKQEKIAEQNRILKEKYEQEKKEKNLKWWIIGWIFFFPIPLTVLIWKSKWDKKKKVIATIVLWGFLLIMSCTRNSTQQNSTASGNEVSVEEDDELIGEIFGDEDGQKSYYFENEKQIRKFVINYNEVALTKISDVEWVNNHKIANVTIGEKNAKLNSYVNEGFLIEFEFNNGEAQLEEYKKIINDMAVTIDSTITEETFNNAFENAKNNEKTSISITDKIKITIDYIENNVGYQQEDTYHIEITAENYE